MLGGVLQKIIVYEALASEGQTSACVLLPMTYLGPIAWFVAAASFPECFIDNQMAYRKQSYRNRCIIMSATDHAFNDTVSPESRKQPGGLFRLIIPGPGNASIGGPSLRLTTVPRSLCITRIILKVITGALSLTPWGLLTIHSMASFSIIKN
jgi:hypothetical protein